MARSINKAIIVGNLTRDPEMRYIPSGQAVTTFGVATNRRWTTNEGEAREDVEFHDVVAWGKLAEICSQLLRKGRKVYIEGRLQTRSWEGKDGVTRRRTEIVASDMVILDKRPEGLPSDLPAEASAEVGALTKEGEEYLVPEETPEEPLEEEVSLEEKAGEEKSGTAKAQKEEKAQKAKKGGKKTEDVNPGEMPF